EIADALDKAHRLGVTHRGLNPSNILLTADGTKLADFGFARLNESSGSSVSASQLSTRLASLPAASLPYAAPYLAPEQFDGAEVDARADIFSFGTVLYEMITVRPAFEGKSSAMLLAAIQTVDPEPISNLQPATPPALEFLVQRCLAKDPKQRLQTARDLLSHLQWISEGSSQTSLPAAVLMRRQKRDRFVWVGVGALVLLTILIIPSAYRYFGGAPESEEVHFVISSMPDTAVAQGGSPVTISPDGRWIGAARLV